MMSRRTHQREGTLHLVLHHCICRRQTASGRGQMSRRNQARNIRHADMHALQIIELRQPRTVLTNLLAVEESLLLQLVARI